MVSAEYDRSEVHRGQLRQPPARRPPGPRAPGRRGPSAAARATARAGAALLLAALSACGGLGPLEDAFDSPTPHERYRRSLEEADLAATALGRRWIAVAEESLRDAEAVELPYREAAFVPAAEPRAAAWRVRVPAGRRLVVEVEVQAEDSVALFLDAFRPEPRADTAGAPLASFRHVRSADEGARRLEMVVERDTDLVVRLQPELLRDVRYEAVLREEPTLAFPVHGEGVGAVRSGFGAPREAGRRRHEGVDIFAPRGTPVLASAVGRVARVGTNRLGGRVVWLREEERGLSLYHAHLDTALVRGGEAVRPGDTLGLVGNSGNARTTPPHLHFGVYSRGRGALDPLPFLRPAPPTPGPVEAPAERLAGPLRTTGDANLRTGPGTDRARLETLPPRALVRPLASTGEWVRVARTGGGRGWVHASLLEPAQRPLGRVRLSAGAVLTAAPRSGAPIVRRLEGPESGELLGRVDGHLYVRVPGSPPAWHAPATP